MKIKKRKKRKEKKSLHGIDGGQIEEECEWVWERERERRDTLAKLDLLTLICLQIKVACEALGLCTTGGGV